jgi:hypothetical protein
MVYGKSKTSLRTTKLHHVLVVPVPENDPNNEKVRLFILKVAL